MDQIRNAAHFRSLVENTIDNIKCHMKLTRSRIDILSSILLTKLETLLASLQLYDGIY